jgi:hypothetical protein
MDPDSSIRLRRIEFVVALLCDRLAEHGHDVDLFCTSGSHSSARVPPSPTEPPPEIVEHAAYETVYREGVYRQTAAPSDGTSRQAQHVGAPGRMTR